MFTDTTQPLVGKKIRIRDGAIVGQDMGWISWKDCGEVFDIAAVLHDKVKAVALGYGRDPEYGNGALFVGFRDLLTVEGHPLRGVQFPDLKVAVEGLGETVYLVAEDHDKGGKGKRRYVGEIGRGEGCCAKTKQEALDLAAALVEAWRFWRATPGSTEG